MIDSFRSKFRDTGSFLFMYLKNRWKGPAKPVLVYQMGKVASSSVYSNLKSTTNLNVYHVHRLNPENIASVRGEHLRRGEAPPNEQKGLFLYNHIVKPRKIPVKIISLVREPIGRNISAFFQNIDSFERVKNAYNAVGVERLIADFLRLYNHDVPLAWFDIELHATTGIDVYRYNFNHEQGHIVIKDPPYDLIIIRHDLEDKLKEKCIAEFLGIESFRLSKRSNEASSKKYANTYRNFIDSISLPHEYVERMLSSKYAQHFYSQEERRTIFTKWT